ncbi:MAG: DUF3187 family protein [Candidatus Binatia bacterium]
MRVLVSLCATLVVGAAVPATAEEAGFSGYGPLPVRNFQPIQLIFLNLPFERARTLRPGELELHVESAESNEIATNRRGVRAVLKFETNRTVIGSSIGVAPGLQIGLDVPFLSRFGGFLDPFVDSVEDLFQTSNPERTLFPNNSFGAFHVRRGNVILFDGQEQQVELGDVWASAKYEVWHKPRFPLVAVRGAIKAPTGRAGGVFGSGKPDFGLGLAAEQRLRDWLLAYANFAVVYPVGPITAARLTLNPIISGAAAAEARLSRHFSVLLQQETYTSPIHGTGASVLEGTVVELTVGLNFAWQPFLVQLGAVNNVSGVATAADFTLLLRLSYQR